MRMSKEAIRLCLKRKELWESPGLNQRLYLHNKGFSEIRNLEPFREVTSLFLEGNALTKIDGLGGQKHLQTLYLQKNKLEQLENLDGCLELKYLDVSNNLISKIDNISSLQNLESLIIRGNRLSKPDSINNVIYLKRLRELDLSKNKINCTPEKIIEILSKCKSLRILCLKGNPIAKSTKHYRKLVVSRCKRLTHLDGKPICSEERRRCKVWGDVVQKGGSYDEADAAALVELNQIKSEKSELNAERNALRRSMHGSSDGSASSGKSTSIGATVIDGIKKSFGLADTRAPSSSISWSSKRNMDESMKRELEELRGTVESQRREIGSLKEQLEEKQSKENVEPTPVDMLDIGSVTDDSERDSSYSLLKNQQLAQQANVKVAADAQHCSPLMAVQAPNNQAPNNRSSSLAFPGVADFDPFSIMPPIPPPEQRWPRGRNTM